MIRCNLAILLAEQNLKITKVSTDTKISRTTLTSLANNNSQGIQLDTINTLCKYLSVTPNDLISFVPFDINGKRISLFDKINNIYEIEFTVDEKIKTTECGVIVEVSLKTNSNMQLTDVSFFAFMLNDNINENQHIENQFIKKIFSQMPRAFLTDFENWIITNLIHDFETTDDFNSLFEWGSEFKI